MKRFWYLPLIFILYVSALAVFSNPEMPSKISGNGFFPFLADKPISEDGFYTLTVARNFAEGKGFIYNFNQKTTGVQPLSVIYYSIIFKVVSVFSNDLLTPLRAVIFFAGLLQLLLGYICYRILRIVYNQAEIKNIVFFVTLFIVVNFEMFFHFGNGLETGLYLVFISATILFSIKKDMNDLTKPVILGLIVGLTTLARIDFFLPAIIFVAINIIRRKISFARGLLILTVAGICLIPWFLYIYSVTGSLVQSSADSQTSLISHTLLYERLYLYLVALAELFTPGIFFGNKRLLLFVTFGLSIIILIIVSRKKVINLKMSGDNVFSYWIYAIFSLLIIYPLYSSAPYFYQRYFQPVYLVILLAGFPVFNFFLRKMQMNYNYLSFAFGIIFLFQAYLAYHSGKLGVHMSMRSGYIKNNFQENEIIGTFQSGSTGYFCGNVYNLDGKIDAEALKYGRKGKIFEYIDKKKINVLIEWREVFPLQPKKDFFDRWQLYSDDIGDGRTAVYVRKDK